jgi:hypothetical protein
MTVFEPSRGPFTGVVRLRACGPFTGVWSVYGRGPFTGVWSVYGRGPFTGVVRLRACRATLCPEMNQVGC